MRTAVPRSHPTVGSDGGLLAADQASTAGSPSPCPAAAWEGHASALVAQGKDIRDPWCCQLPPQVSTCSPRTVSADAGTFSFPQPLGCFSLTCASSGEEGAWGPHEEPWAVPAAKVPLSRSHAPAQRQPGGLGRPQTPVLPSTHVRVVDVGKSPGQGRSSFLRGRRWRVARTRQGRTSHPWGRVSLPPEGFNLSGDFGTQVGSWTRWLLKAFSVLRCQKSLAFHSVPRTQQEVRTFFLAHIHDAGCPGIQDGRARSHD